jgi:hypothetical protein
MATEQLVAPAPVAEIPILSVEKSPVDIKTGEIAQEEPLPFDPAALKERYIAERDKRLTSKGNDQYVILDGSLAHCKTTCTNCMRYIH